MNEHRKLEFYGGEWVSFLPFFVFLVLIITFTFFFGSISDGALWIPAFMAIFIGFFFAKDKGYFADSVIDGMASREAIIPIVCWIFAGVFSRILRESGFAAGIAGVAVGMGVGPTVFAVLSFIAAAVFATASGTGFGTIAAGMGVLYPAGVALGVYPPLMAGLIISGAAMGDNLAPVSDTTIVSATSQGVDVPGVVRSRLKYAAVGALLTIIAIIIAAQFTNSPSSASMEGYAYNANTLWMIAPVILTIIVAIKTGDIIIATTIGSLAAGGTAVLAGLMDLVQINPPADAIPALFRIVQDDAGSVVDGVVYTGIASMLQVSILALLLFGSISIMRRGKGDLKLLNVLGNVAKTRASTEVVISFMIIILSALMGLNAPAILAVGASFAKPLGERFGISPYRVANLMDAQSNSLVYALPWTPAMIFTIGFAADSSAPLAGVDVMPFVFYGYAMILVMFASIFLGIGTHDNMDRMKRTVTKEEEA